MDKIEAIKRTDEALTHLHNLAWMLRDRDPAQADQMQLWGRSLTDLKSNLLDELDEKEAEYDNRPGPDGQIRRGWVEVKA